MFSAADKARLNRNMAALYKRFAMLDDAVFLLSQNPDHIRALINNYKTELRQVVANEINGQMLIKDINEALKDFEKNLERFIRSGAFQLRRANVQSLLESVRSTYLNQWVNVTDQISNSLNAKAGSFQVLAETAAIPAGRLSKIAGYTITAVEIGGKTYDFQQLSNIWERMVKQYGTRQNITYRNGVKYPLTSYIDSRMITTSAETQRLTTIIEANTNGVLFGKINTTGTTDSCIYHENEIVYMSEAARTVALQQWPNVARLKSMRTVDEIRADRTHMFSFGCKHKVLPIGTQFLPDDQFEKEIMSNKIGKVPDKINEAEIYEKVTGKKFEPYERKRQSVKIDAPKEKLRYTIA